MQDVYANGCTVNGTVHSDGSYIFKLDGDEGGEGEFNDDDEQEEDDCKVEMPKRSRWGRRRG